MPRIAQAGKQIDVPEVADGRTTVGSGVAEGGRGETSVAVLTGGGDRPYAFGLATALSSAGIGQDLIAGDELDCKEIRERSNIRFRNLRGDQVPSASPAKKVRRILLYYIKLIHYAAAAKPKLLHILWNNKFEWFDRTVLMVYYKLLGKQVLLTAHNVNARRRDSGDGLVNRITLWFQYRAADHVFVHTEKMKSELSAEFGVSESRITVIPFGINNSIPVTPITSEQAKQLLNIGQTEKTLLFFGNIAPYKGLEYLLTAFRTISSKSNTYRLVIAGRPKDCDRYWNALREDFRAEIDRGSVTLKAQFIPDAETEIYFKAADVLVLPYKHIYQSGVLFLGYSFGLPVLAADVGSLREEVVEGQTGFVFKPEDSGDLAKSIERYFASDLYSQLNGRRDAIRDYAARQHSWETVARRTQDVYASLLRTPISGAPPAESRV